MVDDKKYMDNSLDLLGQELRGHRLVQNAKHDQGVKST